MRVVSLEPFITELVRHFGAEAQLVAVTQPCVLTKGLELPRLTNGTKSKSNANITQLALEDCLCAMRIDLAQLKMVRPDVILTSLPFERAGKELEQVLSSTVSKHIGHPVVVYSIAPVSFTQVLEGIERIAAVLSVKQLGLDMSHRYKAQVMDWADNFYDRMKNKRVSFISSIDPLSISGRWISDMIKLCSAVPQSLSVDIVDQEIEWADILSYRPDVMIVAPRGADLAESLATFKILEKLDGWESLPAVKRGEVIFAEGKRYFHSPGLQILDSMAVLISAIAGFESGYITPRDSFFRLRWMEMQRHRY